MIVDVDPLGKSLTTTGTQYLLCLYKSQNKTKQKGIFRSSNNVKTAETPVPLSGTETEETCDTKGCQGRGSYMYAAPHFVQIHAGVSEQYPHILQVSFQQL